MNYKMILLHLGLVFTITYCNAQTVSINSISATPVNALEVTNQATGPAIFGKSQAGPAGKFEIGNPSNTSPALSIYHAGLGSAIDINQANASNTTPAINVYSEGTTGIKIYSDQIALSSRTGYGIGVYGWTAINAQNTIGVKGESGSNGLNGIGVLGVGGTSDNNAIGVKGISNSADKGAVTGINNHDNGFGVQGIANGHNAVAIYGEGGVDESTSSAAKFVGKGGVGNVVNIEGAGVGRLLNLRNTNAQNASTLLYVDNANAGNGYLAIFKSTGGKQISLANDGDIATTGAVTVNSNKGIVRSSTSSQLRYETMITPVFSSAGIGTTGLSVTITFASAFNNPPVMYVGNINNGFIGMADRLRTSITNVTTTGCTFNIFNYDLATFPFTASWNLVAIGSD